MNRFLKTYEQVLIISLSALLSITVALSVIDLAWFLIQDILTPPVLLLHLDELLEIFAMFLLVLIGIELMETLRFYIQQQEVRAELIILVAIIALARKIITLDFKDFPGMSLLGLAATLVALGVVYCIVKGRSNALPRESLK